jgi:hypothetical protein
MPLFGWYPHRRCATVGCVNTVPASTEYCGRCRTHQATEQRLGDEADALFAQLYDWWDGVWLERHREFFDWCQLNGR